MLSWFKNKFQGKTALPVQGKSTPEPSGGCDILGQRLAWTRANEIWEDRSTTDLENTARVQVVVYACVKKICLTAQEAPPMVGRQLAKGWEDLPDHPLLDLLRKPNPGMVYAEFLWHALAHLLLTGETYIWKWRNQLGRVTELWPVPTSWIKPRYDAAGRVAGYDIWQGAGRPRLPVPVQDVCRIIFPDPTNLNQGLGPLQAALKDVQTDDNRQDYIAEMMENARTPGLIFKQPEGWSPEQKDEIRSLFNQGLSKGKRGRTLFLEGDGATVEQGAPLKDLDWPGLSALSETRICAAFGVPPILIGLRSGLDASTYSNYEQALKSFAHGTMLPTWFMLSAGLTRGLLTDEGETDGTTEVYHDTDEVKALQEDMDKQAERAIRLLQAGVINRNRAREIVGEEPLTDGTGEVYILPMNMIETGGNQADIPPKDNGSPDQ
jgi:HK97 family phage portal protein